MASYFYRATDGQNAEEPIDILVFFRHLNTSLIYTVLYAIFT